MLLHSPEMHIQLMQMLQEGSQGCALGHLAKALTSSSLLWLGIANVFSLLSLYAALISNITY